MLAKTEGLEELYPHMRSAMRGFIKGYFEKHNKPYVFDKNRAWPVEVELLEDIFERPVKIIFPVRPVEEIVASFEKIFRKSTIIKPEIARINDVYKRINSMLDDTGIIGSPISHYYNMLFKNYGDRLMLVPYKNLVQSPQAVLNDIHSFCSIPQYDYDLSKLEQRVFEDDCHHMFPPNSLHGFSGPELKMSETNVEKYIPQDLLDQIRSNDRYKNIA